jgi:large subunit ribosomal protein L17
MRHQVAGRTLGRKTNHRRAMWRNMAVSLFTHEQITTTLPKAKSVKPFIEKLITAAKKGDLASRRRVIAALGGNRYMIRGENDENIKRNKYGEIVAGPRVVKHLFDQIAPRYVDRNGGYTRIIKLAKHRIGDASDLCVLQLISEDASGPQVAGQYSRRRDKANKRMQRAAALRKGEDKTTEVDEIAEDQAQDAPAIDAQVDEAAEADTDTAPSPAPEGESPADEAEKSD